MFKRFLFSNKWTPSSNSSSSMYQIFQPLQNATTEVFPPLIRFKNLKDLQGKEGHADGRPFCRMTEGSGRKKAASARLLERFWATTQVLCFFSLCFHYPNSTTSQKFLPSRSDKFLSLSQTSHKLKMGQVTCRSASSLR